jgi:hypothetical protein
VLAALDDSAMIVFVKLLVRFPFFAREIKAKHRKRVSTGFAFMTRVEVGVRVLLLVL